KIPVFGLGVSVTGNVSVKRDGQGSQLDNYLQAAEIVSAGYPLVIFPEGTRSRNGKMNRFQNSAFMLALEKKAEIVPVVLDTWNVLRPGSKLIRDHHFTLKVLDTIRFDEFQHLNYKEVSTFVKTKMLSQFLEVIQKKKADQRYYRNSKKFRELDQEMSDELSDLLDRVNSI
ncbi:MAG: 1-acyl-sn-glycerol-3-phosphate acyltransferase, partial [Spirochaetes bacterium]|nr:1-acyl-sn-glycerol-3-phosphate acyltransferase [Spirochaetota bacterium]